MLLFLSLLTLACGCLDSITLESPDLWHGDEYDAFRLLYLGLFLGDLPCQLLLLGFVTFLWDQLCQLIRLMFLTLLGDLLFQQAQLHQITQLWDLLLGESVKQEFMAPGLADLQIRGLSCP